jgi:hypothetical protein
MRKCLPLMVVPVILVAMGCDGLRKAGPSRDGGVADADGALDLPRVDAARDQVTSTCVVGEACTPADPCHQGETVCSATATPSCTDTMRPKSDGDLCGVNAVCRGGACEGCENGKECPLAGNPCRVGTTSCATGTAVCTESDNQPDGTGCGGGMVCQAGMCKACTTGEPCTPANTCRAGTLSCAGGAIECVDTGVNVASGSACGKDMVCGPVGTCTACVAGSSCAVAGNTCRTGTTVCNTGAPVCVESGNATNGMSCGPSSVCSGGACVACTAGLACTPTNPCHAGKTVCAPTINCMDTGEILAAGSACGTDKVCSGATCVSCAAGKSCPVTGDLCKTGLTSCATGASACAAAGNVANGSSCGTGRVCMDGMCIACVAGASCTPTNPCHTGTLACSTGAAVCTDTNMLLPDGTTTVCGANRVCRAGMCVSCTAAQPCQLTNLCKIGTTSCATGASVCIDGGNKPPGTSCSPAGMTGMVCNAGVCAACSEGSNCKPANACHRGRLSCATGTPTCVDTAVVLADGDPCGPTATSNLYCRTGICAACTPNMPCTTNPTQCKAGVTSCATGVSVCIDGANKAPGSPCGSNAVSACSAADTCNAGVCNANNAAAGTDCGVCKQCDAGGACGNGYQGIADPSGCSGGAGSCSAADTCNAGVCQSNNLPNGSDCGVCMQCTGGACAAGYQGMPDPTGCSALGTACSGADTCNAGVCQANNLSGRQPNCNGACQTCNGGNCVAVTSGPDAQCAPTGSPPCRTGSCGPGGACATQAAITCWPDADHDGYGAGTAIPVCAAACGANQTGVRGGDCNDSNSNVFPGQTAYFSRGIDNTLNPAANNWDYDCARGAEKEGAGGASSLRCIPSQTCDTGCTGAAGGQGFLPPVECGGTYTTIIGCGGPGGGACNLNDNTDCNTPGTGIVSCKNLITCELQATITMRCH